MTNLKKLVPLTERNNQPTMNMENGEVTAVNPIQPNTDADVIAVNPIQPDEDADLIAVNPIQPDEDAIEVRPFNENADVTPTHPIQPNTDADVIAGNPFQPDENADVIAVNPIQPQEDAVCVWPSNDDVAPVNPIQPGPTYAENGNDTIVIHKAAYVAESASASANVEWMEGDDSWMPEGELDQDAQVIATFDTADGFDGGVQIENLSIDLIA